MHRRAARPVVALAVAVLLLTLCCSWVPASVEAATATPTRLPPAEATPAPSAQPPRGTATPAPLVLYEDDFGDPLTGWDEDSGTNSSKGYESGHYYINVNTADWESWALGPATVYTDFTAELDAHASSGPADGHYGLIFRHQDNNNFYYFYVDGQGEYVLGKLQDGEWEEVAGITWTADPAIEDNPGANHLRVTCAGTQISVYANDRLLTSVEDDSFARGQIGLIAGTSSGSRPLKVIFSQITISEAGAAATLRPPAAPTVLYSDDFGDPDSGWPSKTDDYGVRDYEDGEYTIRLDEENRATWVLGPDTSFDDFTAEVDGRRTSGTDPAYYGLVFRYQDGSNFYYFVANSNGRYRIGKMVDDEWQPVADTGLGGCTRPSKPMPPTI